MTGHYGRRCGQRVNTFAKSVKSSRSGTARRCKTQIPLQPKRPSSSTSRRRLGALAPTLGLADRKLELPRGKRYALSRDRSKHHRTLARNAPALAHRQRPQGHGPAKECRHGHRERQPGGTFGTGTVQVPRARIEDDTGKLACWRMGWDSNPRWGFPHAGFQDQSLKPLGHPSGHPSLGGVPGANKGGRRT